VVVSFFEKMIREIRKDVGERAAANPIENLSPRKSRLSLLKSIERAPHVPLIAEIKWSSPSSGRIRNEESAGEIAAAMVRGGAVGISVLAESRYFGGRPASVKEVRNRVGVPVLYKSIVVHEYQLYEAAHLGADAVLLMVCALGKKIGEFVEIARELGLETVVEIGTEDEVETGISLAPDIIGINNRDMRTLKVDLNRTHALIRLIPDSFTVISESGIDSPDDVRRVMSAGADAVLVGTSIMRAANVDEKVRSLVMSR